eukprot:UN27037
MTHVQYTSAKITTFRTSLTKTTAITSLADGKKSKRTGMGFAATQDCITAIVRSVTSPRTLTPGQWLRLRANWTRGGRWKGHGFVSSNMEFNRIIT